MTRDFQFSLAVAAIAACQLWAAYAFRRLLRREPLEPPRGYRPAASVLVACKGAGPALRENIRSLLGQDYENVEFLFVVPSQEDPAFAEIKAALGAAPNARLLASEQIPRLCSGKALDLLFALERVRPSSEVLAFADADLRVGPDWLARLVAPLAEPGVGASTSCMLYVAARPELWTFLRMVWMAAGIPHLAWLGCIAGQSFAIRRDEFHRLDAPALWSRCLMEDLALAAAVRRAGKSVRFVARAMPAAYEECDARGYFGLFNKWMLCFRVYDLRVWLPALLVTAAHAWIVFWCLWPPVTLWLPTALFLGDATYLAAVFAVLLDFAPDRFERLSPRYRPLPLWAAAAAPLLWATYAVQVASSLCSSRVRWGGRLYRLRGPRDVEVIG